MIVSRSGHPTARRLRLAPSKIRFPAYTSSHPTEQETRRRYSNPGYGSFDWSQDGKNLCMRTAKRFNVAVDWKPHAREVLAAIGLLQEFCAAIARWTFPRIPLEESGKAKSTSKVSRRPLANGRFPQTAVARRDGVGTEESFSISRTIENSWRCPCGRPRAV
jgi:hypothetical protein